MNIPSLLSSIDIKETLNLTAILYDGYKGTIISNAIFEITENLIKTNKLSGYLHIITNTDLAKILSQSSFFEFAKDKHFPVGNFNHLVEYGTLDKKWKIWIHSEMPKNLLVMGSQPAKNSSMIAFDASTISIEII